jgi:phosphate transport system ATP-binding protein
VTLVTDGLRDPGFGADLQAQPAPRDDTRGTVRAEMSAAQETSHAEESLQSPQQLIAETADARLDKEEVVARGIMFGLQDVTVSYSDVPAVRDVEFDVYDHSITALIGPSGCGKSTLIRCLNRTNDLIPTARVDGKVLYHGQDLYAPEVDAVQVRKCIGMVFQKPNPFPKSIFDNIAFGPRVIGLKGDLDEIVERALTRAALWDEVKDRLKQNAFGMSGGQQQRLCIARALATEPDVLLMDEPCSALDPISTGRIEDLMLELKDHVSIVIVTHNMQQAARVSDMTAFFTVELDETERHRSGRMVEYEQTEKIFTNPGDPRTEAYVTGKVG